MAHGIIRTIKKRYPTDHGECNKIKNGIDSKVHDITTHERSDVQRVRTSKSSTGAL